VSAEGGADELRTAWSNLLDGLNQAREAIDSPDRHAPPATDRLLAEGYRYLFGFLFGAVERSFLEDSDFPYFRRAIQPMDKATIDNADALYLSAAIDGDRQYRIRGRVEDHRHWYDHGVQPTGAKAPQYVIFEAHNAYAGDSGALAELAPGGRVITGAIDSDSLIVDETGRFDILVAPERPADHEGNFLCTKHITDSGSATATYVIVRSLFHDWAREVSPELHIAPVGSQAAHPDPLNPRDVAERMRRVSDIVQGQMKFWNEFYDIVLGAFADNDEHSFMPRNGLNAPNKAQQATGGGQSTNVYSGGMYDLGPDEALVIEVVTPIRPSYSGFHLANLWGESLDYANHVSSLNAYQAKPDADGTTRFVVAHVDPGVPNWLDTTGLPKGFLTLRWTYTQLPEELPTLTVTKVSLDDLASHLPSETHTVSPHERREQVRIRQEHVQRRYRQY
jgi:hypothetical protein